MNSEKRVRCYDDPVLRHRSQHPTTNPEREISGDYNRKDVLRLLKIENRQLRSWERQQLVPELTHYRFSDLLLLKRIAKLRSEKANTRLIKEAQRAIGKWLQDLSQPDHDVQVYKDGKHIRVQIGNQKLEPASGQILFDFEKEEINKLLQLPVAQRNSAAIAEKLRQKLEADQWFERGLELERTGASFEEVTTAYRKAAELDPYSAGALVNLGTIFFNGHAWADAEQQYKKALVIDPHYALAHFNLGNLYDEQNDTDQALHHYQEALRIHPRYGDVHYNLALLYQSLRDFMKALHHWRAYLKLDGTSEWAQIAKRELDKLEAVTVVKGNRPASTKWKLAKSGNP